jgi:hypothetical protein
MIIILHFQEVAKIGPENLGAPIFCPFVASDQNTDPKVAGSNPLIAVLGHNINMFFTTNVVDASSMIRFPLDSKQDMPGIKHGPLDWHKSTLTTDMQEVRQ